MPSIMVFIHFHSVQLIYDLQQYMDVRELWCGATEWKASLEGTGMESPLEEVSAGKHGFVCVCVSVCVCVCVCMKRTG